MQTSLSIEIDRPIEEVFDYTIHNVAEWSITVVEDEDHEWKPDGVGSTFHVVTEDKGRRMEFDGTVTKHEPPTCSASFLRGKMFDIDVDYRFEDLGGRTRVTQTSQVHGKGFMKVMLFLTSWMMKGSSDKSGHAELASLKEKLEARAAATV